MWPAYRCESVLIRTGLDEVRRAAPQARPQAIDKSLL